MNSKNGIVNPKVLVTLLAVGLITTVGCCYYRNHPDLKYQFFSPDKEEIKYAEANMKLLFSSAQNTFIHRNQKRMASSIDELGKGYGVDSNGSLIYENIWLARYGAQPVGNNALETKMLSRPYRYAILPVQGINSHEQDEKTSCIIAIPYSEKFKYPTLVMIAGPVEHDPQDFLKSWSIYSLFDMTVKSKVKSLIDSKKPFDKEIFETIKQFGQLN